MDEQRATLASNLIRLRTAAKLTQAELAERINYSDKSISKWERGDGVPDVFVLKQLAAIYGVTVDSLLTPHNETEPLLYAMPHSSNYNTTIITMVAILGIWTLALLAFVLLWILDIIIWQIFVYAVPISLVTYLILHSIWGNGKRNSFIVAGLVFSIIAAIYLTFLPHHNFWQLFLIALPAELVVFLSFRIKPRKTGEKH